MFKFIDSHCHLDQLADPLADLKTAAEMEVGAVVCVGTDFASNPRNLELAKAASSLKLVVALGIHPTEIESAKFGEALDFIRANIGKAKAVGEIGLDFWNKEAKKKAEKKTEQEEVFIAQLKLAKEFDLPVSIHSRGAWQRCLELCLEDKIKKAVFHWYSGPIEVLEGILKAGFFISVTPALMYSPQHQAAAKAAPIEKLFLETDSPVYYGEKGEGFSARPKDVLKTAQLLAALKNLSLEDIAQTTTANAREFFAI
ncbi:MAG: TatD family hydrolase [Candidatus Omnitrophota bacterium]